MNEFADFLEIALWLLIAGGAVAAALVIAGVHQLLSKKGEGNAD